MTRAELREIVASVLEVEADHLSPESMLSGFESFDSVAILILMVELEEKAHLVLTPEDAAGLTCYADIEALARSQGIELAE